LLADDLLVPVVEADALLLVQDLDALVEDVVQLGLPVGRGRRLPGPPHVEPTAGMPDVPAAVGIDAAAGQADDDRIPALAADQMVDQHVEVDGPEVDLDAQLAQVLSEEVPDGLPLGVP